MRATIWRWAVLIEKQRRRLVYQQSEGLKMQRSSSTQRGRKQLKRIRKIMPAIVAVGGALAGADVATAANGTWTFLSSGNGSGIWSVSTNWSGGTIADGASSIADFSTLNITADSTVTLDSSRTIGQLKFGDATTQSNQWTLDGAAQTLTLNNGASQPIINITTTNQLTTINPVLGGTNGFVKSGPGRVVLTAANTVTGQVTFTQGDILVSNNSAFGSASNLIYIDPGSSNNDRIQLNAGVVVPNNITIHTARAPAVNGILQSNGNVAGAGFSGAITIDAAPASGGHISGPNDATGTNFLTFSGPITAGTGGMLSVAGEHLATSSSPAAGITSESNSARASCGWARPTASRPMPISI